MKKLLLIFTAIFLTSGIWAQCYIVDDTTGIIFGNTIGQSFNACSDGNEIDIVTKLGRWPIASSGDSVYVFNYAGDTIGRGVIDTYLNQIQVSNGVLTSPLQDVSIHIECTENFITGLEYRWDVQIAGADFYDAQWMGYWPMQVYAHLGDDEMGGNTYCSTTDINNNEFIATSTLDIIATVTVSAAPMICVGDCDGDNIVTIMDMLCIVDEFGDSCYDGPLTMDLNQDCIVDINDVSYFVSIFGTTCK